MFALAVVLIISLLTFGIATSTTQDHSLSHTQMDAAAALNTAEAAANWEINKLSRLQYDPTVVIDQKSTPYNGPLPSDANGLPGPHVAGTPTIPGTVQIHVTDGSGTQDAPLTGSMQVFASGTVNGVTRSVNVFVAPIGPGDLYTLYGISDLSLASTAALRGWIGAAGQCSFTGNVFQVNSATVIFDNLKGVAGQWAGGVPAFGWDFLPTGTNTPLPTVELIAQTARARLGGGAGPGLSYFQANNDNNVWIKARDKKGNLQPISWPPSDPNHTKINKQLFDFNDNKNHLNGKLKAIVLQGNGAAVGNFPHGSDFYFEEIDIPANRTLEIQNGVEVVGQQPGPVRLWLGPSGGSAGNFKFTGGNLLVDNAAINGVPDPQYFRIYNGSTTKLTMGNINAQDANAPVDKGFYASIYNYNADANGNGYGTVRITGNLTLQGSLVAWDLGQTAGTLQASLPAGSNGGADITKFVFYYRIAAPWTETEPWNGQNKPLTAYPGSQSGFW